MVEREKRRSSREFYIALKAELQVTSSQRCRTPPVIVSVIVSYILHFNCAVCSYLVYIDLHLASLIPLVFQR